MSVRIILLFLVVFSVSFCGTAFGEDESPRGHRQLEMTIDRLISQLGDPSYAMRSRARGELERMGIIAFDALHKAQFHEDSEIAMVARYLVESLHVAWSTEDDSEDVKEILKDYADQPEVERKSRMDRLAELPNRDGLAALCRLVRFETRLRLSRLAALLVMQQDMLEGRAGQQQTFRTITESLGANDREGAIWLKTYAEDLEAGSYNAKAWRKYIGQELDRVAGHTTKQTDDLTVLELYRVCAVRALAIGDAREGARLAMDSLELVEGRKQPLREATSWALDHQIWDVILTLFERDRKDFEADAWLLYAAAEALERSQRTEESLKLVAAALELAPIPLLEADGSSSMADDPREQAVIWHQEVAEDLVQRGRFDWAEREYRYVIDRCPIDDALAAQSRWDLSMMLCDLERYAGGTKILEPLSDRLAKDKDFRRVFERIIDQGKGKVDCRMNLYAARSFTEDADVEKARSALRRAIQADPTDGDVLIDMFQLPGDSEWKKEVSNHIRLAAAGFERNILAFERLRRGGGFMAPNNIARAISISCNQYAWLVCNTEGDFDQALVYCKQAVELRPDDPAVTDTLSHCYYAVGDIDAAVRTQRKAVSLSPYSRPLIRQLEFFISKQAERVEEPNAGQ